LETDILISIVVIILLLVMSGFFSGSEVAFFSIKRQQLQSDEPRFRKADARIYDLLERPRKLLVTILISNTIVNVGIAITAAVLALRLAVILEINTAIALTIEVIVITFLILLFSEISPKILASKRPLAFARFVSFPIGTIYSVLYPVSDLLTWIARITQKGMNVKKWHKAISNEELITLAEVGTEHGMLQRDEGSIFQSVVEFGDTTVREIMGSRVDMVTLKADTPVNEVMELIRKSGHSRIPIYDEDPDDIKGILYAKDLLPFLSKGKKKNKINLKSLSREALFVPESKQVDDLLREFQVKKTHIALVVDEYGGVSGLVTLEDIIEEIVGDIRDEHDHETPYYKRIRDREFLFNPTIGIHEVEEIFELQLTREDVDYDTLGGFLFTHLGKIPEKGQRFNYFGLEFIIERISDRRITRVRVIDKREFISEDKEDV
jgi:putative hemolysin